MTTIKQLWFSDTRIFIETGAGVVRSQPLRFYPRLQRATDEQRAAWQPSPFGLHWAQLDEDISFESFTWADQDPLTCMVQCAA
ncbi:MAG: DUF2442 domain-containing protein [Verrucomicrobiales bacterium]|nr:DUF2442 domain-containing protein [Verrucomicrobiales bacterium]